MKVVLIIATAVLLQSGFGQETKLITISSGFDEPSDLDVISGGYKFIGFSHVSDDGNPAGSIRPAERNANLPFPQNFKYRKGGSMSVSFEFFFDDSLEHPVAPGALFYLDAEHQGVTITLNSAIHEDLGRYVIVSGGVGDISERRSLIDLKTGWHRLEWTLDFVGGRFDDQIDTAYSLSRIEDAGLVRLAHSSTSIFNHSFLNRNLDGSFKVRSSGSISGLALIDNFSLTAPVLVEDAALFEDAAPALTVKMYPGVEVVGKVGLLYNIEGASDIDGEWQPIGALRLSRSPQLWIDEHPAPDRRFYRAVIQE